MKKLQQIGIIMVMLAGIMPGEQASAQRRHRQNNSNRQHHAVPRRQPTPAPTPAPIFHNRTDTTIGSATLEVIQVYKPEVKISPKPEPAPTLPQLKEPPAVQTYEVPPQTLTYSYRSLPLRPLALGTDSIMPHPSGYLKAGIGNLSTIFIDGGFNTEISGIRAGIHLHHLSQKGGVADRISAQSGLEATAGWTQAENSWQVSLGVLRNVHHYYGYDHGQYEFSEDSVKQRFLGIRLGAMMSHMPVDANSWEYHPSVLGSLYSSKTGASEKSFSIDVPVQKYLSNNLSALGGLRAELTQFDNEDTGIGNNLLTVTLGVQYTEDAFNAGIALHPAFGRDNKTLFLPELWLGYEIVPKQFSVKGGYISSVIRNTYEELTTRNPFLVDNYLTYQTKKDEVYSQLDGTIQKHLSLHLRLSWLHYKDLPLFYNTGVDQKQFDLIYDPNVSAFSVQAGGRYQIGETFSLGALLNFTSYGKKTFNRVWHEPAFNFRGDLHWKPIKNLDVSAYAAMLGGIYYPYADFSLSRKLDPILDLGIGAEYLVIPQVSVFMQVNNLMNVQYERWAGYKTYGINAFGGLRLQLAH